MFALAIPIILKEKLASKAKKSKKVEYAAIAEEEDVTSAPMDLIRRKISKCLNELRTSFL